MPDSAQFNWELYSRLAPIVVPAFFSAVAGVVWWAAQHYFLTRRSFGKFLDNYSSSRQGIGDRIASLEALIKTMDSKMDATPSLQQLEAVRGDIRAIHSALDGIFRSQEQQSQLLDRLVDK